MTKTIIIKKLSREEAEQLTETINASAGNLGELLMSAHDGGAWEAMGYESWRAYAVSEFKFSKSQAYRLLDHAKVLAAISPMGENPSERVTRTLAKLEPEQRREVWKEATETAKTPGKPTAKEVTLVVEKHATPRTERINHKPSDGMQFAAMAIANLEKIQPNDTEREKAFAKVSKWLSANSQ